MRFLKYLGYLLLLIIGFGILWPLRVYLIEMSDSTKFESYLEQHHQVLQLDAATVDFNFPDEFYQNKLFMLGENHGTVRVQDVDLALIKHLNQTIGMKWIFAELDPVNSYLFNQYLSTGDLSYLDHVFTAWYENTTQWGNQSYYEKVKGIYAYNQTLPVDDQIRFFGIDRLAAYNIEEAQKLLAASDTSNTMKAYLSSNIQYAEEEYTRYQAMQKNVVDMVNEFGIGDDEPMYGLWGIFHVLKAPVNGGNKPLAMRLAETDLPFSQHIVSISTVFVDSQQNMPSRILPGFLASDQTFTDFPITQANPYLAYLMGISDFTSVAGDADVTLFNVNAAGTPYANSARTRTQTGITSVMFKFTIDTTPQSASDYVILIQNSPAVEAYHGE